MPLKPRALMTSWADDDSESGWEEPKRKHSVRQPPVVDTHSAIPVSAPYAPIASTDDFPTPPMPVRQAACVAATPLTEEPLVTPPPLVRRKSTKPASVSLEVETGPEHEGETPTPLQTAVEEQPPLPDPPAKKRSRKQPLPKTAAPKSSEP